MTPTTRERTTDVFAPGALAVVLLLIGVMAAVGWQREATATAIRTDVLGRERMLTYAVVDRAARLRDEVGSADDLARRIDLLVDQWVVGTEGGQELSLALRPTGRSIGRWSEAGRFGDTGELLTTFADDVRSASRDGVDPDELSRWRTTADQLAAQLIDVVAAASSDDHTHVLVITVISLAGSIGAAGWMIASLALRRRRVAMLAAERAEESTRTTQRFERILRESPDDIVLLDAEGELLWASSGLGLGAVVTSARHLWSLVDPDDADGIADLVRHALHEREPSSGACRLRSSYGQWRHAEFLITNLLDDDGVEALVLTIRDVTDRERAEAESRRLADINEFLTANAAEVLMRVDQNGTVLDVTPAIGPLLHCEGQDVLGVGLEELVHPDSRETLAQLVRRAERTGAPQRADIEVVSSTRGHSVWTSAGVRSVVDATGTSLHVSFLEITERRAAEHALAIASAQSELILDTLSEGVTLSHRQRGVIMTNAAAESFGVVIGPDQVCDQVRHQHTRIEEPDGSEMPHDDSPADRVFRTGRPDLARHLRMVPRHGEPIEVEVNAVPCSHDADGTVELVVLTFADVTAEVTAQRLLERQATCDSLTGLANRHHIERVLDEAAARNRRRPRHVTLLFIDLDGFKAVNDTLGHTAGDQVLVAAADRLRATVRAEDVLGRIGGDEFVILVEGPDSDEQARLLVERLEQVFHEPFATAGTTVSVGVSIGVATLRPGGTATEVLTAADRRMYEHKRRRTAQLAVALPTDP